MKKIYQISLFALLAATMSGITACTAEQPETDSATGNKRPVTLNIGTRAAAGSAAEWMDGDQVRIASADAPLEAITLGCRVTTSADGATYTWNNIDNSGNNYLMADKTDRFAAYYPVTTDANLTAFALPKLPNGTIDQSTNALLHAADYMTVSSVAATNNQLDLELEHRLCRVTITISGYSPEFAGTSLTFSDDARIASTADGVSVAYATGTGAATVTPSGSAVSVKPLVVTNASGKGLHSFTAIVTPGTYAPGTALLTFTLNGLPMRVDLATATTLAAGTAYAYTLEVAAKELTLTLQPSGLPGWNENNETQL